MLKVTFKYSKNLSIIALNNASNRWIFQFSCASVHDDVFKEIKNSQSNEIPVKFLRQNAGIFLQDGICNFNFCVHEGKYPNIPKKYNVTPAFVKDYWGSKEIYCPLSILFAIVKIFEKLLSTKVTLFMDEFLEKFQSAFWTGYITQHCL